METSLVEAVFSGRLPERFWASFDVGERQGR